MPAPSMVRLAVQCPACGAPDIFYSCDPKCCFNHVCGACRASFLLSTRQLGEMRDAFSDLVLTLIPPDLSLPTTACDRCGALTVHSVEVEDADGRRLDPRALCSSCLALLEVVMTVS